MKSRYIGVKFDEYTPQVEGQLTRELIALQGVAAKRHQDEEVVIVCDSDKVDSIISAFGIRRVPTEHLAKTWIIFRTGEEWPVEPEHAVTVIERDLFQAIKEPNLTQLDEDHTNGYYLPPQGRPAPDTIGVLRPAPNGYSPVDPALILLWQ